MLPSQEVTNIIYEELWSGAVLPIGNPFGVDVRILLKKGANAYWQTSRVGKYKSKGSGQSLRGSTPPPPPPPQKKKKRITISDLPADNI